MRELKCLKYPYSECYGNTSYINATKKKNGFLVIIALQYRNICLKIFGPKFLHLILLTHSAIFLYFFACGNIQPFSAYTEQQNYWYHTDPTCVCGVLM